MTYKINNQDFEVFFPIKNTIKDTANYGELYGWGSASSGKHGTNDAVNRSFPIQIFSHVTTQNASGNTIATLSFWKQAATGPFHCCAVKTDGTLWAWGRREHGRLGNGEGLSDIIYSSPIQIGYDANWKTVSVANNHTAAIKTNGTLWTWGANQDLVNNFFMGGQLGLNDEIHRSSPVQVGSDTNWKKIECGRWYTTAIKRDGTLWCWGGNTYGQLGLGDTVHRSSPVQVGTGAYWKQVSPGNWNTLAIKTDGTLWGWGLNSNYTYLGNNAIHRSSPVQAGTDTNWKQVSVGDVFQAAIKTDGTLWTWGNGNDYGELGRKDDFSFYGASSPVQVGSNTNWKKVVCGIRCAFAIKTDDSLWSWGFNPIGALGDNTIISRSSPVQINANNRWYDISTTSHFSTGLTGNDTTPIGITSYL